jgi:hypothetical protein
MITLEVYSNEQWKSYEVEFARPAHALAFIAGWKAQDLARDPSGMNVYHVFTIVPDRDEWGQQIFDWNYGPVEKAELELWTLLNPQCHHGMSESLCMDPFGPHHFGTREQELMGIL